MGASDALSEPQPHSSALPPLVKVIEEYLSKKNSRAPSPVVDGNSKKWYAVPPDLTCFDHDVLRIFIGMFRKHIPCTFPVFARAETLRHDRPEYMLAMAAVGALFCTVSGSQSMARLMYNNARRLHLSRVVSFVSLLQSFS